MPSETSFPTAPSSSYGRPNHSEVCAGAMCHACHACHAPLAELGLQPTTGHSADTTWGEREWPRRQNGTTGFDKLRRSRRAIGSFVAPSRRTKTQSAIAKTPRLGMRNWRPRSLPQAEKRPKRTGHRNPACAGGRAREQHGGVRSLQRYGQTLGGSLALALARMLQGLLQRNERWATLGGHSRLIGSPFHCQRAACCTHAQGLIALHDPLSLRRRLLGPTNHCRAPQVRISSQRPPNSHGEAFPQCFPT